MNPARPMRADARRNYEQLLAVAREAFAQHGVDASLDDIARHAGVGSGTLYRHFPNRTALLEAVFEDRVGELIARGEALATEEPPFEALAAWMRLMAEHLSSYRGIGAALLNDDGTKGVVVTGCHHAMAETAQLLLERAQEAGTVLPDVTPKDLLGLTNGVALASEKYGADRSTQADRLLGYVVEGIRRRS
ncbi:TetR/AcrR family transcriptional regulator [Pseudonocardia sp. TRM90224]|uniref:TetR/AcrR family transcriptional regulator n=1 Tax=Pseudonocardia sp. TRM90224 TaxID=2812678 RepID=UPI001E64F3F3|nr:TetR/AcrR family transcriptional regulator [Pseudonocardia sp. TRM90224]